MKKVFIMIIASFAILACQNDEEQENGAENSLIGTWHPYEWGVKSGKDGSKLQWETNDDCEKKTSAQFNNNETIAERQFISKANGTCEDMGIKNGTYTYNESIKELIIKVSNNTYKYKVVQLLNNEMHLQQDIDYDMNGDGIDDHHIEVFRK